MNGENETVNIVEGQRVEFKTSVFYAPGDPMPGFKQMRTIAETVASFMNAEGGDLYIGVSDDGIIKGIDKDIEVLATMPSYVALTLPSMNDSNNVYKANNDHYRLKIQHILQAFLSPNHLKLYEIGFGRMSKSSQKECCRISVKKCAEDDFVYCNVKRSSIMPVVEEIYVRVGNEKKPLQGRARDEFVAARIKAGFDAQLKAVRDAVSSAGTGIRGDDAVVASVRELLAKLDGRHIKGAEVTVSGGQPFTEESVKAAKKPKSLAWEGQHYAEVSGWQELVLKVFEKLQEINPSKFDELASLSDFRKNLITIQKPREKHSDCYTTKFGVDGKIRIKKTLGNKVYLWREDMALRKIISAFDVDVSNFMFVAE
jgi:hypothetical protein